MTWGLPPFPAECYTLSAYGDLQPDQTWWVCGRGETRGIPADLQGPTMFICLPKRERRRPSSRRELPCASALLFSRLASQAIVCTSPCSKFRPAILTLPRIAGTGNLRLCVGRRQSLSQMASAASTTWVFITFFHKRRHAAGTDDDGSIADRRARRQSPSPQWLLVLSSGGTPRVMCRRWQPRLPPSTFHAGTRCENAVRRRKWRASAGVGELRLSADMARRRNTPLHHSRQSLPACRNLAGTWLEPGGD